MRLQTARATVIDHVPTSIDAKTVERLRDSDQSGSFRSHLNLCIEHVASNFATGGELDTVRTREWFRSEMGTYASEYEEELKKASRPEKGAVRETAAEILICGAAAIPAGPEGMVVAAGAGVAKAVVSEIFRWLTRRTNQADRAVLDVVSALSASSH
jgi:hypothetical protein